MALARRLAVLGSLLVAAAAWSGAAEAAAPVNVSLPQVDGRPSVGDTLTVTDGTWSNSPTSFTYQWQRCRTSCEDIVGATSFRYQATILDVGSVLKAVVSATNADGTTAATSSTSWVIPTNTLSTSHFVVHYLTDAAWGAAITQTQAGDLAARAERAYDAELADGYPAPATDGTLGGDGRLDIYVQNLDGTGALGVAIPDTWATGSSGYVILDGANPDEGLAQHTVAHEVFHLIQFKLWLPDETSDFWLLEGSAEWMGNKVDGFSEPPTIGGWDMSLDCRDPNGFSQCDLESPYKNGGYSRWPFFEYATERWGGDFVKTIFDKGAAGAGSATSALANAIAAKGGSLGDTFLDWSVANMTGSYKVEELQGLAPPLYATIATGTLTGLNAKAKQGAPTVTSGAVKPLKVAVNHLAARYVAIERGDPDAPDTPCYAATLTLRVDLPSGAGARPYFWWSQRKADGTNKEAAKALTVTGNTATITVPWDTCDWGETRGYLLLANQTMDKDGLDFTVTGTLTVDPDTQATATLPPDPVSMPGETVDATGVETVPRVQVFGPQLIRIAFGSTTLRLIVSSSGTGKLRARLGALGLGAAKLRAGSNDVRFRLRPAARRSLGSLRAANLLTLTPLSSSGRAGKSIVRRVLVTHPKKRPHR